MQRHLPLLLQAFVSRVSTVPTAIGRPRYMPRNVYLVQFVAALNAAKAEHVRSWRKRTVLTFADVLGFAAAAATLATFAQRRMLPMRISAVAANVLFMSYGALGPFYPVLLLHALLLPLNLWRLAPVISGRLLLSAEASLLQQWRECNDSVSALLEQR